MYLYSSAAHGKHQDFKQNKDYKMHDRRPSFPIFLASFAVTLSLLAPAPSHAQVANTPYGYETATCGTIAEELKTISFADAPPAPKKRRGLGFLKALGAAAPLVGLGGGIGGAVASTAANAAQTAVAADAGATPADTALAKDVLDQRRAQLTALYEAKRCS